MNRENTERYSAVIEAPEKTVAQLMEENERLTQALYNVRKEREQMRNGFFELISPSLDQWLNDNADDFLETHFDIANHIDDIADALPEKEINFDDYDDELRDAMRSILKYAEIKIEV
jgi:septation ring formation regulator EzrA